MHMLRLQQTREKDALQIKILALAKKFVFLTKALMLLEQTDQCQIEHAAVRYDSSLQACGV